MVAAADVAASAASTAGASAAAVVVTAAACLVSEVSVVVIAREWACVCVSLSFCLSVVLSPERGMKLNVCLFTVRFEVIRHHYKSAPRLTPSDDVKAR
jgi:hypothetical protein